MQTAIDESKIKQLFKEALKEMLEENKGIFHELLVEALEDVALVNAIREGEQTDKVGKQEIFNILEGHA